jgi:DNA-binding transcriptional LysR family regulator
MDLEREINQKFFNRTSKGVIPTLHSNTLLDLVSDFYSKINQFRDNIRKD